MAGDLRDRRLERRGRGPGRAARASRGRLTVDRRGRRADGGGPGRRGGAAGPSWCRPGWGGREVHPRRGGGDDRTGEDRAVAVRHRGERERYRRSWSVRAARDGPGR
ncbi:hypothetical protein FTX61_19430 [Nitriliruptoraceae bacterium ZYF776]|nr:hypothetical protein [Profundirhabdus halotolerans]